MNLTIRYDIRDINLFDIYYNMSQNNALDNSI